MMLMKLIRLMIMSTIGMMAIAFGQANTAPFAADYAVDILGNGPSEIVLEGNDNEGDMLYFPIVQHPMEGDLGGIEDGLIDGEVSDVEAGPASNLYWMFDQDANPFDHSGVSVYAYTHLDWNSDAHGSGGCDGTGLETMSQVFAENLDMVADIDGLEIFLDDLVIQSQEHVNTEDPALPWTTLGEAGEVRVYSHGIGNIKEDGVVKLAVEEMSLWLKIFYPDPVGAGGAAGYASGFGVARIDQVNSDAAWIAAFDPQGTGWVEVAFESFSQTVQGCYGAYDIVGMSIRPMADANLNYTPSPDYVGVDGFSYVLFDGDKFSDEIHVTLNVDAGPQAPEGSGAEVDPYLVADLDDLLWVSDHTEHWDKFYLQTADIDAQATAALNAGAGFSPIGNSVTRFSGNYDGDGHRISGLSISRDESDHQGLFGYTDEASISNLGLIDVSISGADHVGGIIGYNESSTLVGLSSTGTVAGNDHVGGLTGYNHADVSNSRSSCNVLGNQDVGGLIGRSEGPNIVSNSFATGDVSGVDRVGGFIGSLHFSPAQIQNSYSRGEVTRSIGDSEKIGSFAGSIGTACFVEKSYATGGVVYADAVNPENKGFVGFDIAGSYMNNFWDQETSGQSTGNGGDPKTTLLMKRIYTYSYASWDFEVEDFNGVENDWDMDIDAGLINEGYPFLSWENGAEINIEAGSEPMAGDMEVFTGIDEPVQFLLDASDADNDELIFVLWDWATDGDLSLEDSTVTYTPPAAFEGSDAFMYQAYDGLFYSDFATVSIIVAEPNVAPVLADIDPQTIDEDTSLEIELIADDDNGDELIFEANSDQETITVDLVGATLTLTPSADWFGSSQISVIVTDDGAGSLSDTIQFDFTVRPVNDPPQAFALELPMDDAVIMDSLLTFSWHPAFDIDSDGIFYSISFLGEAYSMALSAGLDTSIVISVLEMPRESTISWRVTANDSITFTQTEFNTFSVDESVGYTNFPPTAENVSAIVLEDSSEVVELNGQDENGDSLSFTLLSDPLHGTSELSEGLVTYTPFENFNGSDSLQFIVSDGELADTAQVYFNVLAVNDTPDLFDLVGPDDESVLMDTVVTFSWEASADIDGDTLVYTLVLSGVDFFTSYEAGTALTLTLSTLDLPRASTIDWWVQASDSDLSTLSDTWQFSVDATVGIDGDIMHPREWSLEQNFPNPFNPTTMISYSIPSESVIRLTIYDIAGREIITLAEGVHAPGEYRISWNGLDMSSNQISSGVYLYRLEGEGFSENRRMLFLK